MKNSIKKALEAALSVATSNEQVRVSGRATFETATRDGRNNAEALYETLNQVGADSDTCTRAEQAYADEIVFQNDQNARIALEYALISLTNDESVRDQGRNTFSDAIRNDRSNEEALNLMLDSLAQNVESRARAREAYDRKIEDLESEVENDVNNGDEQNEQINNAVPAWKRWAKKLVLPVIGLAILGLLVFAATRPHTTSTPSLSPSTTPAQAAVVEVAKRVMAEAGFNDQYKMGNAVVPSKDVSTSGEGAFTAKNVKSPEEMVAFLGTGSEAAKALMGRVMEKTSATSSEVLNPQNWIAISPDVPFTYPGNTGYKNGIIIDAGERKGGANDIFLMFANPNNHKYEIVRGACANPQSVVPRPIVMTTPTPVPTKVPVVESTPTPVPTTVSTPTPTPVPTTTPKPTPTLQPKSTKVSDYKHPVEKPVVPVVTSPPESVPPPVIKSVIGPSGVLDTATQHPHTETGVVAPSAAPPVPDRAVAVPTVEPRVNPGNTTNGVNVGDPGNPF
jgi:hypothetical protein